jgi:MerR family transcriptional regulator, copper efflux regulator
MRIGVLAATAGLTAKTIRFYEQAGLLPAPPRTPAGYRDYPPGAAARLRFIREAQAAGLTLAEIGSVLAIRDAGQAPCEHVAALVRQHLARTSQRITELQAAQAAQRELARRADRTDPATCGQTSICTILTSPPPPATSIP